MSAAIPETFYVCAVGQSAAYIVPGTIVVPPFAFPFCMFSVWHAFLRALITYLSSSKIGGAGTYLRLAASLPYLFIQRDCLGPPISPPSDSGTTPDALRGGWVSPSSLICIPERTNERPECVHASRAACNNFGPLSLPHLSLRFCKGWSLVNRLTKLYHYSTLEGAREGRRRATAYGYDKKKIKGVRYIIYQHASRIHPWVPTTIGLFWGFGNTPSPSHIRGWELGRKTPWKRLPFSDGASLMPTCCR